MMENPAKNALKNWKGLFVPEPVLKALKEDRFFHPTPIQALTLPSAIRDRLDIVGAAETGSGKTLAFAIPIIHHILEKQKSENSIGLNSKDEETNDSEQKLPADELEVMDCDDETDLEADREEDHSSGEEPGGKYVRKIPILKKSSKVTKKKSFKANKKNKQRSEKSKKTAPECKDEIISSKDEQDYKKPDLTDNFAGFMLDGQQVEVLDLGIGLDFGEEEELEDNNGDVNLPPTEEDAGFEQDVSDTGCVRSVSIPDEQTEIQQRDIAVGKDPEPPQALILAPTRELAIQVKQHIDKVARYTNIKTCVVVGGMSVDKQLRILRKQPEIVVATPGRLWELVQDGNTQLKYIKNISFLVIDEADRMIEKGHFEELSKLLEHINDDKQDKHRRQTFLFSATLTLIHSGPNRKTANKKKRKSKDVTKENKLESLMSHIGVREKAKIVDLTLKQGTAESLIESRITSSKEDKDLYLYYFLKKYPGRTLVFANSKDSLRRLVSVLKLLQCNPLIIHADMRQSQRLKNLDRFKAQPNGLLLATDVAARGLDIPGVEHVIHFQVPRTSENYVHRSGRTARASKEGLSVMLIAADDLINYRKIIKTLNRNDELPMFPVEEEYLPALKMRVKLARDVDKLKHSIDKQSHKDNWFEKSAREAEIELDYDTMYQLTETGRTPQEQVTCERKLKAQKLQLEQLLRLPVMLSGYSGKYPTMGGSIVMPYMNVSVKSQNATDNLKLSVSNKRTHNTQLSENDSKPKRKKRYRKQTVSA